MRRALKRVLLLGAAAVVATVARMRARRRRRAAATAPAALERPSAVATRDSRAALQPRPHAPGRSRLVVSVGIARASIGTLTPTTRVISVVAVALLVLAPLGLSLARSDHFEASLEAFPFQRAGYRQIGDPTQYMRRLLADPLVPVEAVRFWQLPLDSSKVRSRVRLEPTGRSVRVVGLSDSPDNARDLANAVALALVNASARDVGRQAREQLEETRDALASATGERRAELEGTAARLRRMATKPAPSMVLGPRAAPPQPKRTVDRFIGWLPGPLPPRPGIGWTVVAGLLLASLVSLAAYLYSGARRRPVHV